MKLVSDAKDWWRWFSVWALMLQGAAVPAWLAVPDDMRAAVPTSWMAVGAVVLAALGIVGRLVSQGGDDA